MDRGSSDSDYSISCNSKSMRKVVCIFPHDFTTDFLRPLCDHICTTFDALEVGYDTTSDDDPLELIFNTIEHADTIFFLGHGKSTCLYASTLDNLELFEKNNVSLLKGKHLFLLACDSSQFISNFNITDAVGFGFLPTSEEDLIRRLHGMDISITGILDVECFNNALVQCLISSLCKETMADFNLLKERIKFNVSKEIVDCLVNKKCTNYRVVADELFYVQKDLIIT